MISGKQSSIFIFSLVIIMESMTKKRSISSLFCLQLTFPILEKGFLRLNMHITNDCLVMCVELSRESVVCWNIYIYMYIMLIELVGIVSIGLYPLST